MMGQRSAVVARSRVVRSRWVAAARQPSAVRRSRIAAPCSSPCSRTSVPPGWRSRWATREIVRTKDAVRCYLPDSRVIKVERRVDPRSERNFPALVPERMSV